MPTATVTSKGQITIPKDIRDRLKLHPGDSVDFVVERDGRVMMRQATLDIRALEGVLHRRGMRPVSLDDIRHVIRKRAARQA
jgi:antitoxin PrlF